MKSGITNRCFPEATKGGNILASSISAVESPANCLGQHSDLVQEDNPPVPLFFSHYFLYIKPGSSFPYPHDLCYSIHITMRIRVELDCPQHLNPVCSDAGLVVNCILRWPIVVLRGGIGLNVVVDRNKHIGVPRVLEAVEIICSLLVGIIAKFRAVRACMEESVFAVVRYERTDDREIDTQLELSVKLW